MSLVITKLTCKSGKVITIPTFSYHSDGYAVENQQFGCLYIGKVTFNSSKRITSITHLYNPYSAADLNSVFKMLTNNNNFSVGTFPPTVDSIVGKFNSPNDGATEGYIWCPIFSFTDTEGVQQFSLPLGTGSIFYMVRDNGDNGTGWVQDSHLFYVNGTSLAGDSWNTDFPVGPSYSPGAEKVNVVYVNSSSISPLNKLTFIYKDDTARMNWAAEIDVDTLNNNVESYLNSYAGDITDLPEISGIDTDNPYGGTVDGISNWRGGDLSDIDPDEIDAVDIPSVPTLSATNSGFITIYNPTAGQLRQLANYLWSSAFDIETWQKLFADPMEGVIGLSIVPVQPQSAGTIPVMIGNAPTNVSMSQVLNQFVQLDCGSVSIDAYVHCFLDYDYTKVSIYLPYIGIRELDASDVMDESLRVVYNVDVVTGGCAAIISVGSKGVLYQFNGNCSTNIPITANNFSGAIQNAVSAVSSLGVTAAGAITGAAPIAAMGVAGLMGSAANTVMNSKPSIQKSGNMGGSAGLLSVQKPYVIIQRPRLSVPEGINNFVGNTSNITATLASCKGFTQVEYIHLEGLPATSEELTEIENLLKGGVII